MRSIILAGLALIGVMAMADAQTQAKNHKGYEMPPYTVERAEGAFELRRYDRHVLAQVQVRGDRSSAASQGFRALAGYIFGGNQDSAKVAMTVPVVQNPSEGGLWTIRFMMPAQYTLATLPKPNNAAVQLVEQPPSRQVAVQFPGLRTDATLAAQETALRQWAGAQGLKITAGPHYYFYDGPATLPWNRRNEVAFSVQ